MENEAAAAGVAEVKMSKRDEIITYITFCMMLAFMVLNQFTGICCILDRLCVRVFLVFMKIITVEDVKQGITADLIFMLAGIFTLTTGIVGDGSRAIDRRVDLVSCLAEHPPQFD